PRSAQTGPKEKDLHGSEPPGIAESTERAACGGYLEPRYDPLRGGLQERAGRLTFSSRPLKRLANLFPKRYAFSGTRRPGGGLRRWANGRVERDWIGGRGCPGRAAAPAPSARRTSFGRPDRFPIVLHEAHRD